jgi:hypothetical protein
MAVVRIVHQFRLLPKILSPEPRTIVRQFCLLTSFKIQNPKGIHRDCRTLVAKAVDCGRFGAYSVAMYPVPLNTRTWPENGAWSSIAC